MLAIAKSTRTSSEIELINNEISKKNGHVQISAIGKSDTKNIQTQIKALIKILNRGLGKEIKHRSLPKFKMYPPL